MTSPGRESRSEVSAAPETGGGVESPHGGPCGGWKGISQDVLDRAGVRVSGREVRIPYRHRDGTVQRWRIVTPSKRWWDTGEGLIPFGLEQLDPARPLAVCEGESDCLTLREHLPWLCSVALPGASTWRPEWRLLFDEFTDVYVLGDGDDAGRKMNRAVRDGWPQATPIELVDGDDVRSVCQSVLGPLVLQTLISRARGDRWLHAAFLACSTLAELETIMRTRKGAR